MNVLLSRTTFTTKMSERTIRKNYCSWLAVPLALFICGCVPVFPFMWQGVYANLSGTGCVPPCNPDNELQFFLHPFRAIVLYSSRSRYISEISWNDLAPTCEKNSTALFANFSKPNGFCEGPGGVFQLPYQVELVQASVVLTVAFLFLACFAVVTECRSVHIATLSLSLVFACVAFGVWNSFSVTQYISHQQNAVLPFWNITLSYLGEARTCGRRSCSYESVFDITNASTTIIAVPIKSPGWYPGWYVWVAGLGLLAVTYPVAVIFECLSWREERFVPAPVYQEPKEREIVLT